MTSIATQRLMRDIHQVIVEEGNMKVRGIPLTVTARPTDDLYTWHGNMRPIDGPYEGVVFHFMMRFYPDYPNSPPKVFLCTDIPHPNVFAGSEWFQGKHYPYICLDMLKSETSQTRNQGWSSAYSVMSVLVQLQSFLFADAIDQDYGGVARAIHDVRSIQSATQHAQEYTCSCGHSSMEPWPPLDRMLDDDEEDSVTHQPSESTQWADIMPDCLSHILGMLTFEDIITASHVCKAWQETCETSQIFQRLDLKCFFTKKSFEEDILGFGIMPEYFGNGGIKSLSSPLDIVSLTAFEQHNVRVGVWKEPFSHFLPLALNQVHFEKAFPVIQSTICSLHTDMGGPELFIKVLANLMNSMVVAMMEDVERQSSPMVSRQASERAILGYCAFHHLLLELTNKFPEATECADYKISRFKSDPLYRRKKECPNLGEFIIHLAISDQHQWTDIAEVFLFEAFDRNVRWNLEKDATLYQQHDGELLENVFRYSLTSFRLIMFQVYFLQEFAKNPLLGRGTLLKQYRERLSSPSNAQIRSLHAACKSFLSVCRWSDYFNAIGIPNIPRRHLVSCLQQSYENSEEKGYHRIRDRFNRARFDRGDRGYRGYRGGHGDRGGHGYRGRDRGYRGRDRGDRFHSRS